MKEKELSLPLGQQAFQRCSVQPHSPRTTMVFAVRDMARLAGCFVLAFFCWLLQSFFFPFSLLDLSLAVRFCAIVRACGWGCGFFFIFHPPFLIIINRCYFCLHKLGLIEGEANYCAVLFLLFLFLFPFPFLFSFFSFSRLFLFCLSCPSFTWAAAM